MRPVLPLPKEGEGSRRPEVTEENRELKDIGLGVNTVASRLTSIGVVGVIVVLFSLGLWRFDSMYRDEQRESHEERRLFLEELRKERDRHDMRFEQVRLRNEQRHSDLIKAMAEMTAAVNTLVKK